MKIGSPKRNHIIPTILALCLFFLALIWVSYIRQSSFEKQDAINFANEKNSNLAIALEQFTVTTLRNADAVLQFVRMEYVHKEDFLDLQKLLTKNSVNSNFIEGVAIIGADGRLKMAANMSYPKDSVFNFSDRSYFLFHFQNNVDSLLITKPLVSKTIGKTVIVISRRINDEKGKFAGVVALQMEPRTLTSFYAQAKLLPNDIISLIAPDGITYARRTGDVESSGEDIRKSPLFIHVRQHPDSFYFAKDAIRSIPTWFSYRKLKGYPVIATVGSSEQDILHDYQKRQLRFIAPRVIISILVILFSLLIARILLHRRKLADQQLEEDARYQRLLTEQMIAVQEREREWIGRELHDNVNQVLTTVKLYLEMASKQNDHPLIPQSMKLINNCIDEIRNLSHRLSAPTLGTRSLVDSINALIEMIHVSTHLSFEFDHSGYFGPLNMSQKLALYRILQEQINNIIKHAHATEVLISLSQQGSSIILKVKDNGKGFDMSKKSGGMGFNNMINRARVLDGKVLIESAIEKGCCLSVMIPIVTAKKEALA